MLPVRVKLASECPAIVLTHLLKQVPVIHAAKAWRPGFFELLFLPLRT
jgi:hypothetical protein